LIFIPIIVSWQNIDEPGKAPNFVPPLCPGLGT
jgi:hypothetical protein